MPFETAPRPQQCTDANMQGTQRLGVQLKGFRLVAYGAVSALLSSAAQHCASTPLPQHLRMLQQAEHLSNAFLFRLASLRSGKEQYPA